MMLLQTLFAVMVTSSPTPSIVPLPASLQMGNGTFTCNERTRIFVTKETELQGRMLQQWLAPSTGLPFDLVHSGGSPNTITLRIDGRLSSLGDEGYRLAVDAKGVEIRAGAPAGVFYGMQSLRQLLPPSTMRRSKVDNLVADLPCLTIEDTPRFGWRGAMLDVSRYFLPKESVLKFIDLLALHKLNVLHIHLTDDQGWRFESKRYPKLTEVGAWRKQSMQGHYRDQKWDGQPHGGFYTQDDLREMVAYAQDRFITIVPEIEMPGHATAAIAAYPELGNTNKPIDVSTSWGVHKDVFNVENNTIKFLQDVLEEVLAIFPSKFIHIGGDEVPKDQWKSSERAQEKMKSLGLANEHELQSWFVRQMDAWLASHGRRLIGWDEILEGGLAPGATVMSWRGEQGGIDAAKSGHDVVMAPNTYTYLDYYQAKDTAHEPLAIGGFLPLDKVYGYDPIPQALSAADAKHVLGVQGQLWSEYIPNVKRMEFMAFPRLAAIAEVGWTPKTRKSLDDFINRLESGHLRRLEIMDVNYRKLDKPKT